MKEKENLYVLLCITSFARFDILGKCFAKNCVDACEKFGIDSGAGSESATSREETTPCSEGGSYLVRPSTFMAGFWDGDIVLKFNSMPVTH